jgi:hypothetical protein
MADVCLLYYKNKGNYMELENNSKPIQPKIFPPDHHKRKISFSERLLGIPKYVY